MTSAADVNSTLLYKMKFRTNNLTDKRKTNGIFELFVHHITFLFFCFFNFILIKHTGTRTHTRRARFHSRNYFEKYLY